MAEHSQYVESRRFGAAIITVISEAHSLESHALVHDPDVPESEWRAAMPDADAKGQVLFGLNVILIRIGDASIMVDSGVEDPRSEEGQKGAERYGLTRTDGVLSGLKSIGVRPEQITHVLITHAHGDHFSGATDTINGAAIPRYPNARYLIQRADWEDNPHRDQPDSELSTRLSLIDQLGMLELVDGDREIAPGVTMIEAPGESPGHSIVRVITNGSTFFALGDLFHHPCEIEHLEWHSSWCDDKKLRAARTRLIAEAVPSAATLVFAHERFPPWGKIVPTRTGYRWVRA